MKNVMLLVLVGLALCLGLFFSAALSPAAAEPQQGGVRTCRTSMINGFYVYSIEATVILSPPFPSGPAALTGGFHADGRGNLLRGQDHANFAGTPLDRTFSGTITADATCSIMAQVTDNLGNHFMFKGMVSDGGDNLRFVQTAPTGLVALGDAHRSDKDKED
jgi:hypothetical protein